MNTPGPAMSRETAVSALRQKEQWTVWLISFQRLLDQKPASQMVVKNSLTRQNVKAILTPLDGHGSAVAVRQIKQAGT
jgi:hypothetical protein